MTNPGYLLVNGGDLFVAQGNGTIGEYDLSGNAIDATLITSSTPLGTYPPSVNISSPTALAISGSTLYVSQISQGMVSSFNIATGANIANLFGFNESNGIAVAGSSLFVTETSSGTIDSVDLALDPSSEQYRVIQGLESPAGLTYFSPVATPEPPLWLLLLAGLAAVSLFRPRRSTPSS